MANKIIIPLKFETGHIDLTIYSENGAETIFEQSDAIDHGEAPFQIKEGCSYEYELGDKNFCLEPSEIVTQSSVMSI